jgi:Flp pilus assembly protein TadD/TolB-like protein
LWSLGVTMYEMLTGRLPFEADNSASMLMAIVHQAPVELDHSIPPAVQRIVYRLLIKEPSERYQDIAGVKADLAAVTEARPSVRPVTQSELSRLRSLVARPLALTARTLSTVERWSIASLSLLLIVVVGVVFTLAIRKQGPAGPTGTVEHIAVLPLSAKNATAPDAELSEGLRESITDRLSNLQAADKSLWVVPASEVSAHKVLMPEEAKKAYGANLVVLGRLERQGGTVRLRLELVDANQRRQLGAVEAESSDGNLSELEDTAVEKLESRLGLSPASLPASDSKTPVSSTAYEDYLKALPLIDQWDKPHNLEAASSLLQSAIQQDPKFTLAYVSLANTDLIQYRATQNKAWLEKANDNCYKAQRLNSQLPAVHVTLGRVQDASGRYNLALQEFKRALDLEPHSPDARLGMALVYDHQGRTLEAEQTFKQAVALRPDYWGVYNQLGDFYSRHDRTKDAIEQFRQAIQLAPDSRTPYMNLGAVLIEAGRMDDAIRALEKASSIAPSYSVSANLGIVYFQQKRFAEAERATEQALKLNDQDWRVWTNLASIRRWRNEPQGARKADLRALPLMENASRLKPQDAELQADLGVVYADLGEKKEARSRMETAMALGTGNGPIEAAAAEIEERLSDHKRAVTLFEKALRDGANEGDFSMDPDLQPILADQAIKKSTNRQTASQ